MRSLSAMAKKDACVSLGSTAEVPRAKLESFCAVRKMKIDARSQFNVAFYVSSSRTF